MEIGEIDEMLRVPARLVVLATLAGEVSLTFSELKAATALADGNLHVQTQKLCDGGYLLKNKGLQGKRQVTSFKITELGLTRLQAHVGILHKALDDKKKAGRKSCSRSDKDDSVVW